MRDLIRSQPLAIGSPGHGNADASPDIAYLVALPGMTLQTCILDEQRAHEAVVSFVAHLLDGRHFLLPPLERLQCAFLPLVRGVFRSDRIQAGNVPLWAGVVFPQFIDLAHHVGRIHQGQLFAGRGADVSFRNVGQIRTGRRLGRNRDIHAPVAGAPTAKEQVLAETFVGKGSRDPRRRSVGSPVAPGGESGNDKGPKDNQYQKNLVELARGCVLIECVHFCVSASAALA